MQIGPDVDRCPVCGGADFYGRKDFDPKMGLTVVIIGIVISAAFYWFKRDLIAYSILAAATLVDLVIYGRLKDLTVCYRCHTEFRGPERAELAGLRSAHRRRARAGVRTKDRSTLANLVIWSFSHLVIVFNCWIERFPNDDQMTR